MWARFEDAFRHWARRPPRTDAAWAARQIVTALPTRREAAVASALHLRWRPATATVVGLLLVVSIALWLMRGQPGPASPPSMGMSVAPAAEVLPQDDNVVVWWLDSRTPVYFVMQPDRRTR